MILMMMMTVAFGLAAADARRSSSGQCDAADRQIWRTHGRTWPHEFRALGGLWVSRASYEDSVHRLTGLTRACATCYGGAYICGYDHCKWACMTEGASCDACLERTGCIAECDACTGFAHKK